MNRAAGIIACLAVTAGLFCAAAGRVATQANKPRVGLANGAHGACLGAAPRPQTPIECELIAGEAAASGAPGDAAAAATTQPWFDTRLAIDARLEALLKALTPAQILDQLESSPAAAAPSVGIYREFNWQVGSAARYPAA